MAYSKHYQPGGFQNGAGGATPITAAVCNDWENELALLDMGGNSLTINQGIARPTSSTATEANLLSQIAMLLKEIKGSANWYDQPSGGAMLPLGGGIMSGTITSNNSYPLSVSSTGYVYYPCAAQHVAWYRKSGGGLAYFWRRSDTGLVGGGNEVNLMSLDDSNLTLNGDMYVGSSGVAKSVLFPARSSGTSIGAGTGDGADYNTYNLAVNSWYGIGFVNTCAAGSYPSQCSIFMNVRDGVIGAKGGVQINGNNAWHAGNLIMSLSRVSQSASYATTPNGQSYTMNIPLNNSNYRIGFLQNGSNLILFDRVSGNMFNWPGSFMVAHWHDNNNGRDAAIWCDNIYINGNQITVSLHASNNFGDMNLGVNINAGVF